MDTQKAVALASHELRLQLRPRFFACTPGHTLPRLLAAAALAVRPSSRPLHTDARHTQKTAIHEASQESPHAATFEGRWDLRGAEIVSATLLSTDTSASLSYRVEWIAPPSLRSAPSLPPLLYSLFTESLSRRSVRRVCSVRSGDPSAAFGSVSGVGSPHNATKIAASLSCVVHLPRGEDRWTIGRCICSSSAMRRRGSGGGWIGTCIEDDSLSV